MSRSFGFLIARNPPSRTAGVLTAAALVALCTLIVYPLAGVAPVVSLSVVYLPAVLLVSITWGAWLGLLTGVDERRGVRLLPPAPGRPADDQRLQDVGRAGGVRRGRRARELGRRDRAGAHARRRRPPPRGGSGRRAGTAAAVGEQPRAGAADGRRAGGGDARAALGGDRDAAVQGDERTIAFPLRDGTRHDRDAAGGGGLPAGEPAPAEGAGRALAGGGAEPRARARATDGGRRGRRRPAPRRQRQDGPAAVGLARSALAADGHLRGRRGAAVAVAVGGGAGRHGVRDRRREPAAVAADREPARALPPAGRRRPARGGTGARSRSSSARPWGSSGREGAVQPVDRSRPPAREPRPGPDGARVRERARERPPPLGRAPGVGAGARRARRRSARDVAQASATSTPASPAAGAARGPDRDPGRRPRPGHRPRAARAGLPALLPGRRARPTTAAPGSGWRSPGASPRRTAAPCTSSRCPARARRSCSSCRWRARPSPTPRPSPGPSRGRRRCSAPTTAVPAGVADPAPAGVGDPPGRRGPAPASASARWRPSRSSRRRRPARVLVVDDEPQILRALKVVLRDAGFEAVAAENASEALDIASLRPPQAAIVDLVLPDEDGVALTRRLREWSEMPILVLSAVGEEEEKVRALEAGADDYVTKPFGARELMARLQAALRRSAPAEDEPKVVVDALEIDLAARAGPPRLRAGPPHPDRVRPAAGARAQPRPPADPPRAAEGGVGARATRRTSSRCARTSRGCAPRSSRRGPPSRG